MKRKEVNLKVTTVGEPDICKLSESEQKAFYVSILKLEPLLLINYLVDEIILYNDRIEIRFISPITKSPDDCQSFYYTQIQRLFLVNTKLQAYLSTILLLHCKILIPPK